MDEHALTSESKGLKNGPCYDQFHSEIAMKQFPIVSVGVEAPADFLFDDFAYTVPQTARWQCSLIHDGKVRWVSADAPFSIIPAEILSGFELSSHGLPGIREIVVEGDRLSERKAPSAGKEGDKPVNIAEVFGRLNGRFAVHGKTVAPKAIPKDFKPLAFLDYIVALLQESQEPGWVKKGIVSTKLEELLSTARENLEHGDNRGAAKTLEFVIVLVEKQGCPNYDHCPVEKSLMPEGYALIKYNTQYLLDRL